MRQVGDGTRILNFLIDTLLIFLIAHFSAKGYMFYVRFWGYPFYNFGWFFFGTIFVYYTFFESIFGRTPGKWLSYSKVVNPQGKKPFIGWIILRSLARITVIDLFFIPFLGKPLHDYVSKTTVVEV